MYVELYIVKTTQPFALTSTSIQTTPFSHWATAEAVWKKCNVDGGWNPPLVVINYRVSLKTPQLFRVFLYSLKRVTETMFIIHFHIMYSQFS